VEHLERHLKSVSVNLANDAMTNTVRDDLLAVSMDTLLYVDNIPIGLLPAGFFEGFVEGWTWGLNRRNLELTMSVSNSIYSQRLMYNGKITTH
jgi:hypothetical protein